MSADGHECLQKLIRLLTTAAANSALYNPQHLQVLRLNKQALAEIRKLFEIVSEITLKVVDERLIFDNHPVAKSLPVTRLLDALKRNGISHLRIEPGIYSEELLGLINTLSKSPDRPLVVQGSDHVHFGQVEVRYKNAQDHLATPAGLAEIAAREADYIMDMYDSVRAGKKIDLGGIHQIVNGFIAAFNQQSDALLAIAPLRSMDEYTYTHSTNICMLNIAQARNLGIEGQLLNDIGLAAMLHDVGKMFISPEILGKAGQLTETEWQIMQQHPRLGAEYLLNTPGVPRLAVVTAFEHHMRYDGAGYPRTSHPWTLHLCSHMTAISDTYDAMRTHRAYEESLELDRIITIMLDLAGNKLHPQLTYNFLQLLSGADTCDTSS